MLAEDGRLFHIDFGFIFGRDPKPYPPKMRIIKEMIDVMQKMNKYSDFLKYCVLAFNLLRQHSHLILSLLTLMVDAGIPDLASDPELSLSRVKANFQLSLTDEEAATYLIRLTEESANAALPALFEILHKMAVKIKY